MAPAKPRQPRPWEGAGHGPKDADEGDQIDQCGRMPVIEISTRDPFHFNLDRKHFAMDAPVHYGPVTGMQFPRAVLGRRGLNRAGANPHWECFRLWLDFVEPGQTSRTEHDDLDSSWPRLKDIAESAGVSTSTMRRRLLADGGFRRARERKLVAAAIDRLRNSDDSVESIAAELGYSDARSLRRFLKVTTGATPQQLRITAPLRTSTTVRSACACRQLARRWLGPEQTRSRGSCIIEQRLALIGRTELLSRRQRSAPAWTIHSIRRRPARGGSCLVLPCRVANDGLRRNGQR
jgi:AraC-like DNA-binding protein